MEITQKTKDKPKSVFNMNEVWYHTLSGRQSMLHSLPVSLSLGSVALKMENGEVRRIMAAAAQAKYMTSKEIRMINDA